MTAQAQDTAMPPLQGSPSHAGSCRSRETPAARPRERKEEPVGKAQTRTRSLEVVEGPQSNVQHKSLLYTVNVTSNSCYKKLRILFISNKK